MTQPEKHEVNSLSSRLRHVYWVEATKPRFRKGRLPLWVIHVILTCHHPLPVFPDQQTLSASVGMSQTCQQRKSRSRPTRSNRWCRETGRRVIPEALLCGDHRSKSERAIGRQSIQKCENWVRVRADRPLPPSLLLRVLDEPGQLQGNDKSQHKAGSGGRTSWLPRLPHRSDQDR